VSARVWTRHDGLRFLRLTNSFGGRVPRVPIPAVVPTRAATRLMDEVRPGTPNRRSLIVAALEVLAKEYAK